MLAASKEGIPVEELTAAYNASQKNSFEGLGIGFDIYGSTRQPGYTDFTIAS